MTLVFAPTMQRAIWHVPQIRTDKNNYRYISGADAIRGYERGKNTLVILCPDYYYHKYSSNIKDEIVYRGYSTIRLGRGEVWQNK